MAVKVVITFVSTDDMSQEAQLLIPVFYEPVVSKFMNKSHSKCHAY
jgi:hypothetical protein